MKNHFVYGIVFPQTLSEACSLNFKLYALNSSFKGATPL